MKSSKWEKRAEAARKIGKLGNKKGAPILIEALKHENDPLVTKHFIEALGHLKDPAANVPLLNLLKIEIDKEAPDKNLLFVIIESLMKIGDKKVLSDLRIIYESCEVDIRKLTQEAFECIDPDWKKHLKINNL